MTRYVIIGTGVAGIAAIEPLRRLDRSAEIIVISDDPYNFYSRPGLAYYLSDEIPKNKLNLSNQVDWKGLNVRLIEGNVTSLIPRNHQIVLGRSGTLTYDRLLLATGSVAVPLTVPGANLKGVVKLDTYDDVNKILAMVKHARTAVVVGGGIISLELVEGLAARGIKVHYFMRGDRYWSNVLDEVESRIIEKRLVHDGISIHYRT
jgi:NAD(P)H-nitrite reductase large subunit